MKFTEEQEMLRELAQKFADNEVRPLADEIDRNEDVPMELIKQAADLGFLGIPFPEEYDGADMGETGYCLMLEEIAKACLSTAVVIGGHVSIGTMAVYLGGSEEQKKRFLAHMWTGKEIDALGFTDPGARSDARAVSTTPD